jgi:type III pantothenate kinase
LLDLGNTRYKWIDRNDLPVGEPSRRCYAVADAPAELCDDVFAQSACRRWIVASVRGETFNRALAHAFRARGGVEIHFAAIPAAPPFGLAYRDTGQFGIDRYLNLLAARRAYATPTIVIDAGTAVTVDVLDRSGDHIGGVIFPGLGLLRRSLGQGTELIGDSGDAPPKLLGDSTASGVNGGAWYGFQGALRGIVEAMTRRLGGRATIVATGGDAAAVASALPAEGLRVDHKLLLTGLTLISLCDT